MIFIFSLIIILYCSLIGWLIYGFKKIPEFTKTQNKKVATNFSIIVPFRNEVKQLPQLLKSLQDLKYPREKFEIIFVDDDSSDTSVNCIRDFFSNSTDEKKIGFKILNNIRISKSPKKDAITTAIQQTKFDWTITTDADCILPLQWLNTFNAFILDKKPEMIVAPVSYSRKNNFLSQFQSLDFYSLQAATIGGFGIGNPFLCNGANLCYKKETFLNLEGFTGNDQIASGDDIFLFEKFIKNNKKSVQYLKSKDSIVTTFPLESWNALIQQRVRWAAKSTNYNLAFAKWVGFIVFISNFSLVTFTFLFLLNFYNITYLFFFWFSKMTVDFIILKKINTFYQQKSTVFWFVTSSLFYPFFSSFIAIKSLFSNYKWKERAFKK